MADPVQQRLAARSVTELIALRAAAQPNDPAVHTGTVEFGEELKTLTYLDLSRAVDRLAAHYSTFKIQSEASKEVPPEKVIAVLTTSSVQEILLEIALSKLGVTALLLSTNNSPPAVAHLCAVTNSTYLIYGNQYKQTAEAARDVLAQQGIYLQLVPEKQYPLWGPDGVREANIPSFTARLTPEMESKRTCVILHSSGSTSFPKPVYLSHYSLLVNAFHMSSKPAFSALPLFHAFGHLAVFLCIYHGKALTIMPPHLPITSSHMCRIVRCSPTPPLLQFAVPYVVKVFSETEEGIQTLAGLDAVTFAGAALPDNVGEKLVNAGVNLVSAYGGTEIGSFMSSRRDYASDKGWNWLRGEGPVAKFIELIPHGSDTFELVVKPGWPGLVMSNREDGAFCTKDLMLRHPVQKHWFKYLGRLDDTLTHILGEKTNPVPIEGDIRGRSTLVQECIVFGDGRSQVGALILPSDEGLELSNNRKEYIKAIWPAVSLANSAAPTHSRILPEMIEILPHGTTVPMASKMSIIRPACYSKFAPIIDAVYERFELGSGGPRRNITTKSEMVSFLAVTVLATVGEQTDLKLEPDTDLFSFGIDSIQATRVKNVIVKDLELGDAAIGQSIIYDYPTISRLTDYLLMANAGTRETEGPESAYQMMLDMVERYVGQLVTEDHSMDETDSAVKSDTGHVIVLTGATGSLGAHILNQLVHRHDVKQVICLSRAKSHEESVRRVKNSLQTRMIILAAEAEDKIISFAADVNRPDFGLSANEYKSLRQQATAVIHNAWPVNFAMSVESFDEHIAGAVRLLNLTLQSPHKVKPAFFFSSSVSTHFEPSGSTIKEEFGKSPAAAMMGYGRSKWVVEKIIERASKETRGRCGVLRIGQLAGNSETGIWNETESWPLMFKSISQIHALPALSESPSWLPVNQAASIIVDIVSSVSAQSPPSSATVYHIVNPQLLKWSDVLAGIAEAGLVFDTVCQTEWLDRLAQSNTDVSVNPTYKLLGYYQSRFGHGRGREKPVEYKMDNVMKVSERMRNGELKSVGKEMVVLWVKRWMQSGFLG